MSLAAIIIYIISDSVYLRFLLTIDDILRFLGMPTHVHIIRVSKMGCVNDVKMNQLPLKLRVTGTPNRNLYDILYCKKSTMQKSATPNLLCRGYITPGRIPQYARRITCQLEIIWKYWKVYNYLRVNCMFFANKFCVAWRIQMETFSASLAFCERNRIHHHSPPPPPPPLNTNTSDERRWCSLWYAPEQRVEQTIETPVIWGTIALIMVTL